MAATPELRAAVLAVANSPVKIGAARGRRTVSLFEASVRRLASGQVSRRASPTDFIQLVLECTAQRAEEVGPETPVVSAALRSAKERLDAMIADGTDEDVDDALAEYMLELRHR